MSVSGDSSVESQSLADTLTAETPFIGLKLYLVIGICLVCLIVTSLLIFLCLRSKRRSERREIRLKYSSGMLISKLKESDREEDCEIGGFEREKKATVNAELGREMRSEIESEASSGSTTTSSSAVSADGLIAIGWGRWYGLNDLEIATRGFADENVIGEGGYGIVHRGILQDGSVVAVKNSSFFTTTGESPSIPFVL